MENRTFFGLNLTLATLLSCITPLAATRRCPDCGSLPVPYPLSTGPTCGDPLYKVRCNATTLWLDALQGSYQITSINPPTQRLIIRPPGFISGTCISADSRSEGLQLDSNLPFNVTGSNTVIAMNCTDFAVTQVFILSNCSSSSICHDYIRDNPAARAGCLATAKNCCWFKTGGSLNTYGIRIRQDRCSAYESFVNLDVSLPVSQWPQPGVEIEWALPQEPVCNVQADCQDLPNSMCSPDPVNVGRRRCFCNAKFPWDPINGVCQGRNCNGRHCRGGKSRTSLIGGLLLSAGAMLLGTLITVFVYKKRQRTRKDLAQISLCRVREGILNVNNSGRMVRVFTIKEIARATNNFSKENLLGTGGFGEVFRGNMDDGTITAIKRPKIGSAKGVDQILNEVRILCHISHKSLVRLLGCCVELEQPLLVYEYIPNGTLFDHLHGTGSSKNALLTWHRRLLIAQQTAEGLAYLHSSVQPPIYHRDIKSSNILLDEKLDAKVSDFGLSRLAETDASHITTCAQGTLGYLDPEYYLNFQLTDKSDVYSFGVVLLELLTSNKAIDFNRDAEDVNLVVYIRKILKEDRLLDAVDPVLKDGASKLELETMKALASLAAACLDERRQNRPSMKEAADEIGYIISLVTDVSNS